MPNKKTPSNPKGAGRPRVDTTELNFRVRNKLLDQFGRKEIRRLTYEFLHKLEL